MVNFLILISTIGLLVICGLMTIIILMQKPSANAGMGAALGGGAAESVFGGETANVLLKYTVRISVAFYLVSFLLYIGILAHNHQMVNTSTQTVPMANLVATPAATPPASSAPAVTPKVTLTPAPSGSSAVPATSSATVAPAPAAGTPAASGSAK